MAPWTSILYNATLACQSQLASLAGNVTWEGCQYTRGTLVGTGGYAGTGDLESPAQCARSMFNTFVALYLPEIDLDLSTNLEVLVDTATFHIEVERTSLPEHSSIDLYGVGFAQGVDVSTTLFHSGPPSLYTCNGAELVQSDVLNGSTVAKNIVDVDVGSYINQLYRSQEYIHNHKRVALFRLNTNTDLGNCRHSACVDCELSRFDIAHVNLSVSVRRPSTFPAAQSSLVAYGNCKDGAPHLEYALDEHDNIVPDFSQVGYMYSPQLPAEIPNVLTLRPSHNGKDDTERISQAIAFIKKFPVNVTTGYRGAVLLAAGEYLVASPVLINVDGVVIRGVSSSSGARPLTTIRTTSLKRYSALVVGKNGRRVQQGAAVRMTDNYVPVGARYFTVERKNAFAPGDSVVVHWHPSDAWIRYIEMHNICKDIQRKCFNWTAKDYTFPFERVVAKVVDYTIYIDVPLITEMDAASGYGWGEMYKYTFQNRIHHVGVEHLAFTADYVGDINTDIDHADIAVLMASVEHAFVQRVHCYHFSVACVKVLRASKHVTVTNSSYLAPVSPIAGGLRYPWLVEGSMVLVQHCLSEYARHDSVLGSKALGPNVFFNNVARYTYADVGPHHRWAVGVLFDSATMGPFSAENRKHGGSGHGWSGAQIMYWNSHGHTMKLQSPPGSRNYAVGTTATFIYHGAEDATLDRMNVPVTPHSLYRAQLHDRVHSNCYNPYIVGGH